MSEHTPLTEAEVEARMFVAGDVRDVLAEATGLSPGDCNRVAWQIVDALAARTSTATADTGLRERVEALRDEWDEVAATSAGYAAAREGLTDVAGLMDFSATMTRRANELRAALDATAAPTTDTGARDE